MVRRPLLTPLLLLTAPLGGTISGQPPDTTRKQGPKVWENYDFVPGSKVLFYTDFTEDRVGNYARGLKYLGGPGEIVERDGVKVLRATGLTEFLIPVGKKLPDRFTLEIDAITSVVGNEPAVAFKGGPEAPVNDQSANVIWNPEHAWIADSTYRHTNQLTWPEEFTAATTGRVAHLRALMDGEYFKMYVNERRIFNIPVHDPRVRLLVRIARSLRVHLAASPPGPR